MWGELFGVSIDLPNQAISYLIMETTLETDSQTSNGSHLATSMLLMPQTSMLLRSQTSSLACVEHLGSVMICQK